MTDTTTPTAFRDQLPCAGRCRSYNLPEWGGDDIGVIADDPWGRPQVQLDRCVASAVLALWDAGIRSHSSCCGHGKTIGHIMLAEGKDVPRAKDIVDQHCLIQLHLSVWSGGTGIGESIYND
jgi:hypothetical protein